MVSSQGSAGASPAVRRWWIAAASAVAVVVVIVAVVLATRGQASPAAPPTAAVTSEAGEPSPSAAVTSDGTAPSAPASPTPAPTATTAEPTPSADAELVPGDRPTVPPVAIEDTTEPTPGVSVRMAKIESVQGVANLPGEVGGPALRVTVEVSNTTDQPVDLSGVVVNLYLGTDRRPAIGLTEPGSRPMPAGVDPGGTADGVYVFNVPSADRALIAVEVDLAVDLPVMVFEGAAPSA